MFNIDKIKKMDSFSIKDYIYKMMLYNAYNSNAMEEYFMNEVDFSNISNIDKVSLLRSIIQEEKKNIFYIKKISNSINIMIDKGNYVDIYSIIKNKGDMNYEIIKNKKYNSIILLLKREKEKKRIENKRIRSRIKDEKQKDIKIKTILILLEEIFKKELERIVLDKEYDAEDIFSHTIVRSKTDLIVGNISDLIKLKTLRDILEIGIGELNINEITSYFDCMNMNKEIILTTNFLNTINLKVYFGVKESSISPIFELYFRITF